MNPACSFPDPRRAPREAPLAFGGDLSVDRLLAAYRQGIFPWYEHGEPILWWSPDPRFVLFPNAVRGTSSLLRTLKEPSLTVTLDTAFAEVIEACAKIPRHGQTGTWITTEMIDSYIKLYRAGYAHSVECRRDGVLVGGLYGVSLGHALGREAYDLMALNDDLEDMLAALSLLDEYVTVSNTNVHLRIGAGGTCRVLVPNPAEYRWMSGGDESPWFPGSKVYRQRVDGDWGGAFAALIEDLGGRGSRESHGG